MTDSASPAARDRLAIEVTPAMIEAGRFAFLEWFDDPALADDLVSLPDQECIDRLLSSSFRMMLSRIPDSSISL